jgi:enoyl-CoA hydratase/carnithine racemase
MTQTPEDVLLIRRQGHVAVLTLNRPDVMNARNRLLRERLAATCADLDGDDDVRVVVITGAGSRAFCTGLDLKEVEAERATQAAGDRIVGTVNDIAAVAAMRTPTVAAVNGVAVGGGLELALACDLRIAAETARFGLTEVKRGNIPGNGGTQRLPRLIGTAPALELLLTGALVDASRAAAMGLVGRVADDALDAAIEVAESIAQNAPLAVLAAKRAVREGSRLPLDDALALEAELSTGLRSTEDWAEGVSAFAEKRDPRWTGR